MLFSLYGLVQIAQDENEANDQIQKTSIHLWVLIMQWAFLKQMTLKILVKLYKKI